MKRIIPLKPVIDFDKNLDFIKEYDLEHFKERLYIHYDILSKCNLDCSYCYAKKDYGEEWGRIPDLKEQKIVLKSIALSKYPVFLGFLGGEPSIHPHLSELVEIVYKDILKNEDSRFYITTNGVKRMEIPYHEHTFILMSYHLEFNYRKAFFRNLEYYLKKGFKVRVNQMLLDNLQYYDEMDEIFNELRRLSEIYPKLSIHPHFIYENQQEHTSLYDYSDEFYQRFGEFRDVKGNFIYETSDGYVNLNDYYIFKYNLNRFKGWWCYHNNFEISYDGKVTNLCKKKNTYILDDINYFRKIKLQAFRCPYESCVCDGLLKVEKWKDLS